MQRMATQDDTRSPEKAKPTISSADHARFRAIGKHMARGNQIERPPASLTEALLRMDRLDARKRTGHRIHFLGDGDLHAHLNVRQRMIALSHRPAAEG